jgi:hypothetical protein
MRLVRLEIRLDVTKQPEGHVKILVKPRRGLWDLEKTLKTYNTA